VHGSDQYLEILLRRRGSAAKVRTLPDATTKSAEQVRAYGRVTEIHNAMLYRKLDEYAKQQQQKVTKRLLPFHGVFRSLVDDATCYGMVPSQLNVACLQSSSSSENTVCADPFAHLFWDDWHPLTHNHKHVADAVVKVLLREG